MEFSRVMEKFLVYLYKYGNVEKIITLKKDVDTTASHSDIVVMELEKMGLVNTQRPEGSRSRKVFLSEKGKKVARALTNYYEIFEEQTDRKFMDFNI